MDEGPAVELTADDVVRMARMIGLEITPGDEETVATGLAGHLAATVSLFELVPGDLDPAMRFDPSW
jgi:hypothetical protein